MNLKEEYEKRKQRREAVNYFRKNNDAFLSPEKTLLLVLAVLITSIIGALIQAIVTSGTSIRFGIIYILIAYMIYAICHRFTSFFSKKVVTIAYIGYVVAILATPICSLALYTGLNYLPQFLLTPSLWLSSLQNIALTNPISWFSYILGGIELYYLIK